MSIRPVIVLLLLAILAATTVAQVRRPIPASRHSALATHHSGFKKKQIPTTRSFGLPNGSSAISLRSTVSASTGKIIISGNLGAAESERYTGIISNAGTTSFSTINWPGFKTGTLPNGILLRSTARNGEPEIPSVVITCAVPESAKNFRIKTLSASTKEITNILLPPAPLEKDGQPSTRIFDRTLYRPSSATATLSQPARFRRIRFITITIPLAAYNANLSSLLVQDKFTYELAFDCTPTPVSSMTTGDPVFADAYKTMVANPQDISKFQCGFDRKKRNLLKTFSVSNPTFDSSVTSWIDPSAVSIKVTTTRPGLYRVAIDELVNRSHNNSISTIQSSSIRLINHGKEVPVWIETNPNGTIAAIEFYAERIPGLPNEYYNWNTDSNAYWLTNSSRLTTPPLRYTANTASGTAQQTVSEANLSLHHERDLDYYIGDVDADESKTKQRYMLVSGERFIWKVLRKESPSVVDSFFISSLPADLSNKTATVDAFIRGISSGSLGSHTAALLVNGSEAAVNTFNDFSTNHLANTALPLTALHQGWNTVEVQWRNSNGENDQFYFDHIELSLPLPLEPNGDTAITRNQWLYSIGSQSAIHSLVLTSPIGSPILYDLTHGIRATPSATTGSQFTYLLNSTSDSSKIAAAVTTSFLHPDRITDQTNRWAEILDTLTETDYIIIAHPKFFETAKKLKLLREGALKTKVILVDDIYDAFNYGSGGPEGIKRFLQYAFDFYHGIPPSLVTLFGDATWDPKFNLNNETQDPSNRTIHQCYIPTYGVPSTDYYYTLAEGPLGAFDPPEFVIGRIPVETVEEAEGYLAKLIEYENEPPSDWNRNFLFVSGGDPQGDHPVLLDLTVHLMDSIQYGGTSQFPINAHNTLITRTDGTPQIDVTHIGEIQSAFKQGQSIVHFFGHGATNLTDILFPDIGTLTNPGLYPVFITLSCRTGAFAEPNIITMNESYLRAPNKGIIMGFGTTGFDGTYYSFYLSARIFNFLRGDSLGSNPNISRPINGPHKVQLPVVFTLSKYIESVVGTGGLAFENENALYEITILGDAALGFIFRPQPELHATSSDVKLSSIGGEERSIFSVCDSQVRIHATLKNFGYGLSNTVRIRFRDDVNGNSFTILDSVSRLDSIVTIDETLLLDSTMIGTNTLHITIDPDQTFAEQNENDNEAIITFLVSNCSAIQFYPPDGGKNICDVTADSVRFMLLLSTKEPVKLEIEVDTTSAFTHPTSLGSFSAVPLFFEHTVARTPLPKPSSGVLWWRSRTTSLSSIVSEWQVSSVSLSNTGGRSSFSYTTSEQFERSIVKDLSADAISGGLHISRLDTIVYEIQSHGARDTNNVGGFPVSQFHYGDSNYLTPVFPGNASFNGIVLLVLTPDSRFIESINLFFNPEDHGSDSLCKVMVDSFTGIINKLENGRHAVVLTNLQPFIGCLINDPKVTAALQSLGSVNGFQGLQFFGSYSLFGTKGFSPGSAKETFAPEKSAGALVVDTLLLLHPNGQAEFPTTMAATSYGKLSWKSVANNGKLQLLVIGVNKLSSATDTLQTLDASNTSQSDLSSIDPNQYNKLKVLANFQRDTSFGPVLSEIDLQYDIAPEYEIDPVTVSLIPSTVEEGFPSVLKYTCTNRLCTDGKDVPVILLRHVSGKADTLVRHIIPLFAGHSSMTFLDTVTTTALNGSVIYTVIVNPNGVLNEQLTFNNSASATLNIKRDTAKPRLDLVFDGHHINNGDYVSSRVDIEVRLTDSSPLQVTDTGSIGGTLFEIDPPGTNPRKFLGNQAVDSFTVSFITNSTGQLHAKLNILPERLHPGTYLFEAFAKDATGNAADTVSNEFVVAGKNGLEHVMNYPNPFKDKTFITFILRQAGQASVKVPIYTITGRKIRTLELDGSKQRVGLNAIEWDGHDENGNDIANGTYLYKVVLNGTNEDGTETSEAIMERAVRSR